MGYTGSAPNQTYQRTDGVRTGSAVNVTADNAAVNNTPALADARENDLAAAINLLWLRNGGNQPTANLPMNSNKFTGMAQGSARTDSLRIDQVQDGDLIYAGTVGGTANAIELTMSPVSGGGVEGMMILFIPGSDNTSSVTVDVDGEGATALEYNSAALSGGEIRAGQPALIMHDGTNYQLLNPATITRLNSTASGVGASLVGIEDSAGNFTAITVEAALAEIIADYAATSNGNGASKIGIEDSGALITATTVEGALAENRAAIDAIEAAALLIANNLSDLNSASTARTNLGLGSLATASNINNDDWSGTDLSVANGGSGRSSHTAYAVVCGGTSSTGAQQSVSGVGSSGQVLTSNGSSALPTWQGIDAVDVQTFSSSGTWTKPSGYATDSPVLIRAWGGGGGGCDDSGGGGGGYNEVWVKLNLLASTETVTIGAGGTATSGSTDGNAGGNTTMTRNGVAATLTAYGGGGGAANGSNSGGGGGGGPLGAGQSVTSTAGGNPGAPFIPINSGLTLFAGQGGSASANDGQAGIDHGGGGAGRGTGTESGGDSVRGGGGGGGLGGSGGTSVIGGHGGGEGQNGTAPAGGGGAGIGSAGNGAAGRVEVYVFRGA